MAKVTIAATIPVAQYANVQPSFEIESDTHEAAVEIGLQRLRELWDRVGEKPLNLDQRAPAPRPTGRVYRCQLSGQEVLLDADHVYRSSDGGQWLSGSKFASRYKVGFPGASISQKMSEKYNVPADEIQAMWALNAEASATFGTAVHAALELRERYGELSQAIKGSYESALTSNPVLRPIVDAFFEGREGEKAFPEVFVANPSERTCGLIDRLAVDDDGGLWTEDFKTNTSIEGPEKILPPFADAVPHTTFGIYLLQLSFYSRILMAHGRNVKGVRIHHWTGSGWVTHENEVINLDEAFK